MSQYILLDLFFLLILICMNKGSLILFILYKDALVFNFQVKSPIQNIIQVPTKLLWMRWDRISYNYKSSSTDLPNLGLAKSGLQQILFFFLNQQIFLVVVWTEPWMWLFDPLICSIFDRLICSIFDRLICSIIDRLICFIFDRLICSIFNQLVCSIFNRLICSIFDRLICSIFDRLIDCLVQEVKCCRVVVFASPNKNPGTKLIECCRTLNFCTIWQSSAAGNQLFLAFDCHRVLTQRIKKIYLYLGLTPLYKQPCQVW